MKKSYVVYVVFLSLLLDISLSFILKVNRMKGEELNLLKRGLEKDATEEDRCFYACLMHLNCAANCQKAVNAVKDTKQMNVQEKACHHECNLLCSDSCYKGVDHGYDKLELIMKKYRNVNN